MRALLVYRDGSLGFEEVKEDCHALYKAVRMPVFERIEAYVAAPEEIKTIPILRFIARGKAGPYKVFEETGSL